MLAQKSRYFTLGDCFSLNFVGQSVTLSPYMGGEVRKTIVMTERRKKKTTNTGFAKVSIIVMWSTVSI